MTIITLIYVPLWLRRRQRRTSPETVKWSMKSRSWIYWRALCRRLAIRISPQRRGHEWSDPRQVSVYTVHAQTNIRHCLCRIVITYLALARGRTRMLLFCWRYGFWNTRIVQSHTAIIDAIIIDDVAERRFRLLVYRSVVRLSLCLSLTVCHVCALCSKGRKYRHDFFPIWHYEQNDVAFCQTTLALATERIIRIRCYVCG